MIWIRAGSITAGSSTIPFVNNLTIQINGNKNSSGFAVDPNLAGSKMFVVTGSLNLFGISPSTISAKLTATALKGATTISVSDKSGWNIGD